VGISLLILASTFMHVSLFSRNRCIKLSLSKSAKYPIFL